MATKLVENYQTIAENPANIDNGVGAIDQLEPRTYLQECINIFDRTLEQVLDVDTFLNVNNSHHLTTHHDIECIAPESLSLENFYVKNETFSTYLDHIELDDNCR